ncbi:MAG: dehydrogenase [Gemmatimonadetes bacterium]|nr:MAG: dehydrogenase [Gemmatimonadota bacterium]
MASRAAPTRESPPIPAGLARAHLLEMYRFLRLTRTLEERLTALYRQSKVIGGLFRSLGQEGESVASAYALERGPNRDVLSPLIRNLGSMLVKGATPVEILRQYMNVHFNDLELGYLGQISHLGDMIPVMTGIALTFKLRGEARVGLVYIGDGATSTGTFHEGLNFAAVQKVPLIVIGEYNRWAYSTPPHKQFAVQHLADKAQGYGIPATTVDGNDVLAVYEATRSAVERARRGEGVHFIEVKTYRRKGHAEHDDQHYVPRDELERWAKENDPVDRYVRHRRAGPGGDRRGDRRLRRRAPAGGGYGARRRVRRPAGGAAALVSDSLMADVTYLEALRQGLWEEMERDPRVFILGEDVGLYGGAFKVTDGFVKRFGESRVIDTPISEAAIVGAAAGAAHMGLRPVAEMQFIDFISCAYDMLTNYVATARYRAGLATPIVVRGPCGGYVRGGPFHSQNPEAAFFHTPGLKIVYPATARDAKGLIKASIRDDDPVIYLEHKWLYRRIKEPVPEGEEILTPIGEARLAREGKHLSIVTYGATVWKSLEAAEQLEKEDGLSTEVLDLRTLLPMDDAAIMRTVQKTNKVLLVHEDTRTGGVAGEIAARINEQAFAWLDGPIMRVTAHDVPLPYAPTLEDFVLPQTEDIVKAARWLAAY